MRRTPTLLVLSILVATASRVAASPVDLFGFGARGQGMSGAVQATAAGFESVYYNPAGLAFDLRPSFALGYQYGVLDLEVDGAPFPALDTPALNIGFGVPIPFGGALARRVSLGLGFTIPQTSILIADIERPGDPTFVLVENRAQTVSVQGALGIRLADGLALGIGALALAELAGDIRVAPNAAGRLGSKVRDELVADYALVAGLLVRPLGFDGCADNDERLAVALTWRSESRATFSLPLNADLGEDFPIPIPEIDISGTAQFDPAEASIEVAGRPWPWLLLAAGLTWEGWSTFPQPIAYSAVPEGTLPLPSPAFEDTWAMRVGVEAELRLGDDVRLLPRLGFALEPSPVPEQTGFHNHLDSDRTISALGLGLRIGALRVDLAGQWQHLAERTSVKDPDDPMVDPETHPGVPSITSRGDLWLFSFEVGLTL
jgi:long-chain fatty acid transport protein